MIELDVPGYLSCRLEHLALDMNGTIALDGEVLEGVADRLQQLAQSLEIHLLTADTHGGAHRLETGSYLTVERLAQGSEDDQKRRFVEQKGAHSVVAIGNGANDVLMLREAALSVAVLGGEGAAVSALDAADIVTTQATTALDLLLHPLRLVATLRR